MFNNHFSNNLICLCCLDYYLCNCNAKIKSNCQHLLDHRESKGIPEKNIYFCFIDYTKAFDCVDHNILWKNSSRDGNTIPPDLPLEKSVCRSGSNS